MSCHDTCIAGVWVAFFQECQRYYIVAGRFHADESATELAFAPERLSGEERNAVRKEAMALGYTAKSRGGGAERHLASAVQKPPKGAAPPKRPAAAEPSSSDTAEEEKHKTE